MTIISTNDRRAHEGLVAVNAYRTASEDHDLGDYEDIHAFVALLAALKHLCDAKGWDFGYLDKQAYGMYTEDKGENGPIATAALLPAEDDDETMPTYNERESQAFDKP